jgi:hypothetical protein
MARKLNPHWDNLLTPVQRGLLAKPGFGITQQLPYLNENDVKEIMNVTEEYIKHIELIITHQ